MIKKITYIFIGLLIGTFVTIANAQVRVLTVPQGGTGAATLTGCLQGNGTSAITGTGSACGSGSGSSVGWASTTADINSIYFTGGSTGKVGIGSTSPYAKLSVTNTSTSPSFIVEDSTSPDGSPFIIDASGNVGIGTTGPTAPLHIHSASLPTLRLTAGAYTTGYDMLVDTGGSAYLWNRNNGMLTFGTNNTEQVRITSTGNVGIGTTTPDRLLTVSGLTSATTTIETRTANTNPAGLELRANVTGNNLNIGNISFNNSANGNSTLANIVGFQGSSSGQGALIFSTRSSAVFAERMRFDTTGNTGIGTSSPWGFFSVTNTGTSPSFVVEDSTSPDSTPFIIDASGNVGIGTTSPYGVLSVINSINTTANTPLLVVASTTNGTATSTFFTIKSNGDVLIDGLNSILFKQNGMGTIPYASTTALSGDTLCISTDCRTAWPAGGAGGSGAGFASTTLDINSVYFTGGSTGKIGIGTSTPNATLTIAAGKSFYSEQSILSTSTSMTVDFDNGQNQLIRTGVSDTTIAFSNGKVGQKVELTVCNPTTTSGAISFTGNVSYRGGISPSHTTTANECDIYVWQVNYATSTAKYFLMDMKSGFR